MNRREREKEERKINKQRTNLNSRECSQEVDGNEGKEKCSCRARFDAINIDGWCTEPGFIFCDHWFSSFSREKRMSILPSSFAHFTNSHFPLFGSRTVLSFLPFVYFRGSCDMLVSTLSSGRIDPVYRNTLIWPTPSFGSSAIRSCGSRTCLANVVWSDKRRSHVGDDDVTWASWSTLAFLPQHNRHWYRLHSEQNKNAEREKLLMKGINPRTDHRIFEILNSAPWQHTTTSIPHSSHGFVIRENECNNYRRIKF